MLMINVYVTATLAVTHSGWPQSSRKKFPEFSRLFHSHNYTFPEVIAAKISVT